MVRQRNKILNSVLKNFRLKILAISVIVLVGHSLSFAGPVTYNKEIEEAVIQGRKYLEDEEYSKAIALFKQLLKKHSENPDLNYCLGFVYYKSGDMVNAQKGFKKTIQLDDKYTEAYYFLAVIADKMSDKENVIVYLNKVIYLDPQFQSAYYNKGVVFLSLNEPERAIKDFAYALYLSPKDHSSVIGILKAYDKMNMMDAVTMIKEKKEKEPLVASTKKNKPEEIAEPIEAVTTVSQEKWEISPKEEEKSIAAIEKEEKEKYQIIKTEEKIEVIEVEEIKEVEAGKDIQKDMKIIVYSPEGWEKTILLNRQLINLKSYKDKSGMVEINFSEPADLKNKYLYFEIKGDKGGEELRCVIKDSSTKRSPEFAIYNIYEEWGTKAISIEDNAHGFLDEKSIVQIKIKLLNEDSSRAKASIRNVRIE